ncbi:MAG: 5-(carboxyamino)imidazole ribonucleotide synthase [Pseudomonadota bacterium]
MGHDIVIDKKRRLAPGDVLGILGGGQLGRMIALAAARLGIRTHIYCPDPASPAFDVTPNRTIAAYDDASALAAFADGVDAVTFEFENVPAQTAEVLEACTLLRPNARALAVSQDRLLEKTFFRDRTIPTAPFAPVSDEHSLAEAMGLIGTPSILKTRTLGYDGKGQRRIDDAGDASDAWSELARAPAILEGFVPFAREVSLVMARGLDGDIAFYDMAENRHENHILRQSVVPATLPDSAIAEAHDIGRRTLADLDYVGVLAVELFVVERGTACDLVVNEIAPRVHNSGHWTEAACPVSQFEQHVRAVCGWPLGSTSRMHDVEMSNLLGSEAETWQELAREPGTVMHLYGKAEARPGRKMGHITRILGPKKAPGLDSP